MTLASHIQGASLGAKVVLYQLDLTLYGLGLILLSPGTAGSVKVSYGGEEYSPHPITAEGFEMSSAGSLPRPTIGFSNIDNSFTALVEQSDDLYGAQLTRIRTYERFLDTGAEPDGNAHLPLDLYTFDQKTKHTRDIIQWDITAAMDQEGVELPSRMMVRDFCGHRTRVWNGAAFDYTNVTCPYVGTPKDANGNDCAAADEVFSKRLGTCCQARFGVTGTLPTRAFPGMAQLKAR